MLVNKIENNYKNRELKNKNHMINNTYTYTIWIVNTYK